MRRGVVAVGARCDDDEMALQITCLCGFVFRDDTQDGLWAKAQDHIRDAHPDQVGKVTRDDIIGQAELV
jgi:hypothetical protein